MASGVVHLFLVVVIVFIGIGGLIYYSWQKGLMKTNQIDNVFPTPTSTENETANWKTYNNKKFNYAIKYPPELKVGNGIDPESAFDYVDNLYLNDKDGNFVDIFHEENPNKLTVDQWLDTTDRGSIYNFNNSTYEKKGINGGTLYVFNPPLTYSLDSSAFKWAVLNKTDVYLIGNKTTLTDSTVEMMISTFKFLDSESDAEGKFCGGIMGLACPEGYDCKLDGNYPDAGGTCVKN